MAENAPTEAGWHWWRAPLEVPQEHRRGWQVVQVYEGPQGMHMCEFFIQDRPVGQRAAKLAGTWGERIPDSDTLKARRELAEKEPITLGGYGVPDGCAYCTGAWAPGQPHTHAPDCPWLRAQPKPAEAVSSSTLELMVVDVTQEEWDAASEEQRDDWRRLTKELCGEEKTE